MTCSRADSLDRILSTPERATLRIQDPFLHLPAEVKCMIIEFLQDDIQAVAELRLSSRAFRQLPQFFYRTLILTLMPWIWEAQELIAEKHVVDWQKLWRELCRVDGLLQEPVEEKGRSKDEEKNYFFDFEPEQKRWLVCNDLYYGETDARPGSELWKKAEDNYVRVDEVTIPGLKNRWRVWQGCESLLDFVDENSRR